MSKFTAGLEKRLESYAAKIETTIQAAKDLPEIGYLYPNIEPGRVRVDVPFTKTAYVEYRQALGNKWRHRKGMEQAQAYQNSESDNYWYFVHKETSTHLTLCLDAMSEYATCKRVKVGVKEVAIFETVCSS